VSSVTLFDQGLIQVVQAAIAGLQPKTSYVFALASQPDGAGLLQPLAGFTTNPAGAAIVNAIGPIRQLVQPDVQEQRRYFVVAAGTPALPGAVVQTQTRQGAGDVR
jgi:hypothetical protein